MPLSTSPRPTRHARRPLCLALSLALALGIAPAGHAQPLPEAPPQVRLPALGESASDDFNLSAEKRLGEQWTLRLTGSNLLDSSKDEAFDKFTTIDDQFNRDYDEYELETESAGRVYQFVVRYAF